MPEKNAAETPARDDQPAGRAIPTDRDALLHQAEVAYLTAQSERTLEAYRLKGGGPSFVVIGKRGIRYRRGDVLDWIEARRRQSTGKPAPDNTGGPSPGSAGE